jgi:hypothetical protein
MNVQELSKPISNLNYLARESSRLGPRIVTRSVSSHLLNSPFKLPVILELMRSTNVSFSNSRKISSHLSALP